MSVLSRSNLEKINVRAILSPGTKHWSVIMRYMSVLSARVSVKRGLLTYEQSQHQKTGKNEVNNTFQASCCL